MGPGGGVHDLGDRVVDRLCVRSAQIDGGRVRRLPGLEASDPVVEPEAARPAEGRHAQHVRGGACRRVPGRELSEEGGRAHLSQHVEVVVAGRPVRAEGDVHPGRGEAGHRAESARELEVRFRTVHDRGAPGRELLDLAGEEVRHVYGGEPGVDEAEPGEAGKGAFPRRAHRVLDLARRLVQVNVHREVESLREVADPLERLVAHRVRRVRREGRRDQRVAAERLVHLEAAGEVRIPIPGPRGRHLEDDEPEHGPDPDVPSDFPHDIRKEVHVVETGSPPHQHLGRREARPGPDERLVHEPGFGRPHVLREPGVQGQVVGEAAEQGHRGVGVGVDEPRDQRMAVEVHALARREPRVHLVRGTEGGDGTAAHRERVTFEDAPGRLDRDDPGSAQ